MARREAATRLYLMAVGNRQREPVWSFLSNELLDTMDEAYVSTMQRTGRVELSEAEMLFTRFHLRNDNDRKKLERAIEAYKAELFQRLHTKSQAISQDPTRTAFEKALWKQVPAKCLVFIAFSGVPHEWVGWMPMLTRSSLYAIHSRLSLESHAIDEVSCLSLCSLF